MSNTKQPDADGARRPRKKKKKAVKVILVAALAIQGVIGVCCYLSHRSAPGSRVSVPDWVQQELLPVNPYSRPGTPLKKINAVVIHYVANPGTSARANRNYFANLSITHETKASAHFVVGLEGEILQCVPLSEVSYCSNNRNGDTIAIEVCHPEADGKFSDSSRASVVKLTAWLCRSFGLSSDDVIRHYDITGKNCPKYYVENPEAWQALLQDVQAALESGQQ